MQHEFKVYGARASRATGCGTPIEKIRAAGRGTWYCPRCQRSMSQAASFVSSPSRSSCHNSV
jgi:formamidopyrimidine-DNA glycosylase